MSVVERNSQNRYSAIENKYPSLNQIVWTCSLGVRSPHPQGIDIEPRIVTSRSRTMFGQATWIFTFWAQQPIFGAMHSR